MSGWVYREDTPPLRLRIPHQFHNLLPDRRCQAVPIRDKLAECRVGADIVQALASLFDASIMRINDLRNLGRGCNSGRPNVPFEKRGTPYCRFARTGGASFGPCGRRSASDDPGRDGYLVSRWHGRGGRRSERAARRRLQAETGCPAASRRNKGIVDLATLGVGWVAARFGKNLVRPLAVRPQCGYNRSRESQRCK